MHVKNEDESVFFFGEEICARTVAAPGRNEEISFHDIDPRSERSTLEGVAG